MKETYSELLKEINGFQIVDRKPVVAVCGLMNAGKSYLLNMLTQHTDEEFFKTNDIRETAEVKSFETNDCIFLDTPGLDASEADDETAIKGAFQADVYLFVHQPQGELEPIELNFLKNLVAHLSENASKHIIMVFSKTDKDRTENTENIEKIKLKSLAQIKAHLGFELKSFNVSGKLYLAGVKNQKSIMIDNSHIAELAEYLQGLVRKLDTKKAQQTKYLNTINLHLKELEIKRNDLDKKINSHEQDLNNEFSNFQSIIKSIKNQISRV